MPPTNLDLDQKLVAEAMRATGLRTKKAVVEEGLRALIRLNGQQDVRRLRGMMQWEEPEPEPAAPAPEKTAKKGKGGADPR
ncbi:MAG TPA: type II toxin-antitoxin system VapB family antitoxin [Thermoanaerobaculia bacterium]|jgi:Arc/MetJ family transcription regulator|nr:type II toxin-antitoxin system VapB family antitoxin [Thermoanaerobaculia bacterium]